MIGQGGRRPEERRTHHALLEVGEEAVVVPVALRDTPQHARVAHHSCRLDISFESESLQLTGSFRRTLGGTVKT